MNDAIKYIVLSVLSLQVAYATFLVAVGVFFAPPIEMFGSIALLLGLLFLCFFTDKKFGASSIAIYQSFEVKGRTLYLFDDDGILKRQVAVDSDPNIESGFAQGAPVFILTTAPLKMPLYVRRGPLGNYELAEQRAEAVFGG